MRYRLGTYKALDVTPDRIVAVLVARLDLDEKFSPDSGLLYIIP